MRKNITHYSVLISCPGDVIDDIKAIEQAIHKFNSCFSSVFGIYLEALHWSKDVYAQSGGSPQSLIDKQIVHPSDAAIALLWTRFGTPTEKYSSGTEEEIAEMIANGKQVFMFFCNKKVDPSLFQLEQYQKVMAFKDSYSKEGLYQEYSSRKTLEELVFANLSKHFLSNSNVDSSNARQPQTDDKNLSLCSISNAQQTSQFACEKFETNDYFDCNAAKQKIIDLVRKISEIPFTGVNPEIDGKIYFGTLVLNSHEAKQIAVDSVVKSTIEIVCSNLNIALASEFFSLGNLRNNPYSLITNGDRYLGTNDEIRKNDLLNSLYKITKKYEDLNLYLGIMNSFYCLRLAITNSGHLVDEDIDIKVFLPLGSVVHLNEIAKASSSCYERLVRESGCKKLFSIKNALHHKDYWSSISERKTNPYSSPKLSLSGQLRDFYYDYNVDLRNEFPYEFFSDSCNDIICLHIDRIKHKTTIAFPTVVLLHRSIKQLKYSISSANQPDVLIGILNRGEHNE